MGLIRGALGCAATIASFLVSILALSIILVTAFKLQNVDINPTDPTQPITSDCILGSSADTGSNCVLLEIAGGITIGLAIAVGLLQCLTCHFCGLGGVLDILFAAVGTAIWATTSVIISNAKNVANAVDTNANNTHWRETVVVMSWIEFALFTLIVLVGLMKCCSHGRK